MNDELKELSLRLERLEKVLDTVPRRGSAEELSAEEIRAYAKVRVAFGEGGTCGINETSPCVIACLRCAPICRTTPIPICRVCDFECTCGPCAICGAGGGGFGGGGRFGGLGG